MLEKNHTRRKNKEINKMVTDRTFSSSKILEILQDILKFKKTKTQGKANEERERIRAGEKSLQGEQERTGLEKVSSLYSKRQTPVSVQWVTQDPRLDP